MFRFTPLSLAVFCLAAAAHAENLAPNPGFEQEEPDGTCSRWFEAAYSRKNQDGACLYVTDAARARRGSRFWELTNLHPSSVKAIHCGAQHMDVRAGRSYLVRVWAQGHGTFALGVYGYAPGKFVRSISSVPLSIDSDEWEQHSLLFSPYRRGDELSRVRIDGGHWTEIQFPEPVSDDMALATPYLTVVRGTVCFDDVCAYDTESPAVEEQAAFYDSDECPFFTIGKAPVAPTIDGRIGLDEWRFAGAVTGFVQLDNEKAERETTVYACYDDQKLYVAFAASYSGGLGMGESTRDAKFANHIDAIELWIKPPDAKWIQFVGMPAGGILDQNEDSLAWNGGWDYKTTVEDSGDTAGGVLTFARGTWHSEVSIRFSELGVRTPQPGETWRMNFCRDFSAKTRAARDWTSWSPTCGAFANPDRFGYVAFGGDGPVAQIVDLGAPADGNLAVSGRVTASTAAQVEVQLQVEHDGSPFVTETRLVSLSASGSQTIDAQQLIKVSGSTPVRVWASVLDRGSGHAVLHTKIPYRVRPSFRLAVTPLFRKGFVDVGLDASRLGELPDAVTAVVTLTRALEAEPLLTMRAEQLSNEQTSASVRLDLSGLPPGDYAITGQLSAGAGHAFASSVEPLSIPEPPDWLGSQLGVTEDIPAPFVPVKLSGRDVSVTQRRYTVADSGLPRAVTATGAELLCREMSLQAVIAGAPVACKFEPLTQRHVARTDVSWGLRGRCGPLTLTGELTVEYDGFARWTVRIDGPEGVTLDSLSLDYDMPRARALYARAFRGTEPVLSYAAALYNQGRLDERPEQIGSGATWFFSPSGWERSGDFFHTLWIGDDDRGLALVCETDEFIFGERYIEISTDDEQVHVRVHLVSEPTVLSSPLRYDYAWQATPLKPRAQDPKRWRICYGGGSHPKEGLLRRMYVGLDYHALTHTSYPALRNPQISKRRIQTFHDHGAKIVTAVYLAASSKETDEWRSYGREWEILPRGGWSSRIQGPAAYACPKTSFFDYLVHACCERVVNGFGYDGMYLDVSGPMACENAYHPCGYERDGKRHAALNLFTWRELYKRLYTYLHTGGREGVMFRHGMRPSCIAAFVDAVTQGEEWCMERDLQYRRLSPDMFRCKEMRTQFGTPYTWYTFHYYAYRAKRYGGPVPRNEILTMCLLHRVLPTVDEEEMWPIWDLMDKWWVGTEFVPYWSETPPASTGVKDVFASAYVRRGAGQALLVVGNWNYEPKDVRLRVHQPSLGIETGAAGIKDELSHAETGRSDDGTYDFELGARDLRIFHLGKAP